MITNSFIRNMQLNKTESEKLLAIIQTDSKNTFKVTTSAKKVSQKTLDKVFGKK